MTWKRDEGKTDGRRKTEDERNEGRRDDRHAFGVTRKRDEGKIDGRWKKEDGRRKKKQNMN